MHLDSNESVWFQLGMNINTIEFYILILVSLTLMVIQGDRSARKQKLLWQLSHKVFYQFRWNLVNC